MLIRLPDVMIRTGLKRSTIYNLMRDGKFPKPAKISERLNGWPADEVHDFIEARKAARNLEPA